MHRINQYDFYELGYELHALTNLHNDTSIDEAFIPLINARKWLRRLLDGHPIELRFCKHEAENLSSQIQDILGRHLFKEGTENIKPQIDWEKDTIPGYVIASLNSKIAKFENNFSAELRGSATYYVPKRGIYDTADLVDSAENSIPGELRLHINDMAIEEFKSAGRCLAFNLPTAAGFHACRAVESTLVDYYSAFLNKKMTKKYPTMHDYISELQAIDNASQFAKPDPKTLRILEQIRAMDRNPLMHPREVLDLTSAQILFQSTTSALMEMAREMKAIKVNVQTKGLESLKISCF